MSIATLLMRLREVNSPPKGHTATKGRIWDLIPAPQARIFLESPVCAWHWAQVGL